MAAAGFVVAAPVLLYLTFTFGSPLPATLAAKRAQIVLGVTGFYAGTTYLEGLLILVNGWLSQTWLYVIPVIALLVGLALAILRDRWVLPFLLWACVQIVAYTALGVAPYFWYYAPLVPAMVWLIATSAERGIVIASKAKQSPIRHVGIASTQKTRLAMTLVVCLIVLVPFVISIAAIWQAQSGPLPGSDTDASKVLPEAKVTIYRRVGEWIEANTPRDATLGATEVGIIGFYARRTTIDFLGLLQPDVARALTQGDPSWTLFAYQPDYLALTAVNPIYNLDPRRDDWFQAAYRPIQRFDDARFWGSPVVIYRREVPRVSLPEGDSISPNAMQVNVLFGKSIRLLAVETSAETIHPGDALAVRLWWRAESPVVQDYRLSVQLLGRDDLIVAQRDGEPGLGVRPISTWSPGKVISDLVLIGLPKTTCAPDIAQLNIVLYDSATGERLRVTGTDGQGVGDSLRLGRFDVKSASGDNSGVNRVDVSFAHALTLTSYKISPRALSPGETLTLSLGWQTGQEWREGLSVFVHLVADDGKIIAQADGPPTLTGDWRSLRVPPSASLGVYRLLVGVYRPETGERLPWADAVGQPLGDSAPLCPVRVR
jgi:hypothetical protein